MEKHYLDADVLYGLCETKPTAEELQLYIVDQALLGIVLGVIKYYVQNPEPH